MRSCGGYKTNLPLVFADRYGLAQVFLNLSLNSLRAMAKTPEKQLTLSSSVDAISWSFALKILVSAWPRQSFCSSPSSRAPMRQAWDYMSLEPFSGVAVAI